MPLAVTALGQNSRSIDADGQSDTVRDIETATPVAGFVWITTCSRWMIQDTFFFTQTLLPFLLSA
jgi:hypothetical protein